MEKSQDEKPDSENENIEKHGDEVEISEIPSDRSVETSEKTEEVEQEYISGFKLWMLLAAATLAVFLMMLDQAIIVTAIPRITNQFHSLPDVGWYGSAFLISSCALQPLTGRFYSLFPTKLTYAIFVGVFEIGSALCGAARSSKMLIIGRAVAGLGGAGIANGAITILSASTPMHKRPALLGIMMSFSQIGIVAGPTIGGVLTQYASWRWCFFINLPIGAVAVLVLLIIHIPEEPHKKSRQKTTTLVTLSKLDFPGFFLFASCAVMFLLALEWGGTAYAWRSATIIGLFCGSGVVLCLFAAWEVHVGDDAMLPPSMVSQRIVWCSCLVIFFFFGCLLTISYYLPIYFQSVKGVSPSLSGVYVLPGILSQMLGAVTSGFLVGRWGYYLPWSVAGNAVASVGAGLLSTLSSHSVTAKWVIYQMIAGLGRGICLQMPLIAVQNLLPPEQNSSGMALIIFAQTFGGALFLSIAETIFSHGFLAGLRKYAPAVNAQAVVAAGATGFRQIIDSADLAGVLHAYAYAIDRVFYLSVGVAVGAFICAWGIGWRKIKKEQKKSETSKA